LPVSNTSQIVEMKQKNVRAILRTLQSKGRVLWLAMLRDGHTMCHAACILPDQCLDQGPVVKPLVLSVLLTVVQHSDTNN
jgi:hypothetical protein